MTPRQTPYQDLHEIAEDDRIRLIGHHVMRTGETVLVVTDDEAGKMEGYIQKITTWFPMVETFNPLRGPVSTSVCFNVRKKPH